MIVGLAGKLFFFLGGGGGGGGGGSYFDALVFARLCLLLSMPNNRLRKKKLQKLYL